MNIFNENYIAKNVKIGIIISRFNYFIGKNLLFGSKDTLTRIGKIAKNNIDIIYVPGAYEIPFISQTLIKTKKYHALITLGVIIQGKTFHFQEICRNINSFLIKISLQENIPIISGILMTHTTEEALERAGNKYGNKGTEAALTTLEILNLIKSIKKNKSE